MRVLVIGDVHGKIGGYFDRITKFLDRHKHLADEDLYSIQLGDFGFGDTYMQSKNRFERSRRLDSDKHVFLGGNHDDYDEYDEAVGSLGDFGQVPFIENSFFVRGAKSIDEDARTVGHDWWRAEELGWKRSKEAIERYVEVEPEVMFSHDAPQSVAGQMFPSKTNFETHTGKMLEEMFKRHKPEKWLFGHWHKTKTMNIDETAFQCLGELETINLIQENEKK